MTYVFGSEAPRLLGSWYGRGRGREDAVARKAASMWPHLDERRRRLVLGAEARSRERFAP